MPRGTIPPWAWSFPGRHLDTAPSAQRPTLLRTDVEQLLVSSVPGRLAIVQPTTSDVGTLALMCFETGLEPISLWSDPKWLGTPFRAVQPGPAKPERSNEYKFYVPGWGGALRMVIPTAKSYPTFSHIPISLSAAERYGIEVDTANNETAPPMGWFSPEVQTVHDDHPVARLQRAPYPLLGRHHPPNRVPEAAPFHFLPAIDLLVVVPYTNREVLLHRAHLADAIEQRGSDLFVLSVPADIARRGTTYSYPLQVYSRHGGVQMRLAAAPPGATLSEHGVLSWQVPDTGPHQHHHVEIQLTDRSGTSRAHQFDLLVPGTPPPRPLPKLDWRTLLRTFTQPPQEDAEEAK